jgi:transposase
MDAKVEGLRTENRRLRARVAELEARNAELEATVGSLREKIAGLEELLERTRREGKRQAAPFRKPDGPRPDPRKPGRKSGEEHGQHAHRQAPPPESIDEHYEAPLPGRCPHCGSGDLQETEVVLQYQTEIPRRPIQREFRIHRGKCRDCGRSIQGRHALQTSDATGAAAAQLGPEAHAAMAILNKKLGLSHGKVADAFKDLFGIDMVRGTSAQSALRTGGRCEPAYESIRTAVRNSPWIVPDETGWRVGGRPAWLHGVVAESATYYEIVPGRGHEVLQRLLGEAWSGLMIHDGWGPYDTFLQARHQQCLRHLRSRCAEILRTATGGAVRLSRQVLELIDLAFAVRREYEAGRMSADQMVDEALGLGCALEELVEGRFTYEPNRRLAKHLAKHSIQWFWFLIEPGTDATNYRAEQAMRPAVVNRKVRGGNRTWIGAKAQSVLTSVIRTCEQLGLVAIDYLVQTLCAPRPDPALLFRR